MSVFVLKEIIEKRKRRVWSAKGEGEIFCEIEWWGTNGVGGGMGVSQKKNFWYIFFY